MTLHALLAAAMCAPCLAQDLYTIDVESNQLQILDMTTLNLTDIGELDAPFDFGDLAWDGKRLFMVQGYAGTGLYEVNIDTGAATLIGEHGYADMFGLEYDPTTDTLYGSRSSTGQGLFTLDRATGEATFVGPTSVGLDTLSYDTKRDLLIGAAGGGGKLYTVDRETGAPTLLQDGEFFNNCGMAYVPDDDEHWLIDQSGSVYRFDPENDYFRTSVLGGLTPHDGLTFVDSCTADCNGDGVLSVLDFVCFQQMFQAGHSEADCDGNGLFTVLDFICFQGAFKEGC